MSQRSAAMAAVLCACLAYGCRKGPPANVAATVNSRPITYAELDKQFKMQPGNEENRPEDDQALASKLEFLRALIDREIMFQRAEKQSLIASDSEVDARLNQFKAPYTQEEFERVLKARKLTQDELRSQLRRDLSVEKLYNKEITGKISISDKDIADFYNANKAHYNLTEPQLRIAQIVVTPTADPNPGNLKGNNAQTPEQAREKIELIQTRLKRGEDFAMVAQNLSEDPNTAPNGGDLGFVPESALERVHPEVRKIVLALQPGQTSPPIQTPAGFQILKLISREPAGQRELNDPRVQQEIREQLLNGKDRLLKTAYIEVARSEAEVRNYFAARVLENQRGKK
ncbi:MAG TPA: peptidylprolyl isomerase [Bryobacteraceae bacterium]|nr:peptidylprolyl isomerase [Bryobacteraceae bacterium]